MFESEAFREVGAPRLLSLVRVLLGLIYLEHGVSKYLGFPTPQPQNFHALSMFGVAGIIEIIGSVMIVLGLYTRWVALIMSGEMAYAYFIFVNRLARSVYPLANGGELEAVLCLFFFTLFLVGDGAWSLDRMIERRSEVGSGRAPPARR
jgi:putative oxidoreductase